MLKEVEKFLEEPMQSEENFLLWLPWVIVIEEGESNIGCLKYLGKSYFDLTGVQKYMKTPL